MLRVNEISKIWSAGTANEKNALRKLSLHLKEGDFLTVIGSNGAGKSTLLNAVAGVFFVDSGSILIDGQDVTALSEHRRASVLGRVFQDPMMGTASNMTIEENLALSYRRGKRRGLRDGISKKERAEYREALAQLDLGLEDRMGTSVGLLSGGQRQALTLLMATIRRPLLLLLDEHTASLDPKTASKVLQLSEKLIKQHNLTTLMVTHNMKDAIRYGNKLIMVDDGRIIFDACGKDKEGLTVGEMIDKFSALGELDSNLTSAADAFRRYAKQG